MIFMSFLIQYNFPLPIWTTDQPSTYKTPLPTSIRPNPYTYPPTYTTTYIPALNPQNYPPKTPAYT